MPTKMQYIAAMNFKYDFLELHSLQTVRFEQFCLNLSARLSAEKTPLVKGLCKVFSYTQTNAFSER